MRKLINYRNIFFPAVIILIAGTLGGFLASTAILVLILMFSKKNVLELFLVLLIFTFFLGDSLIGPFVFAQNFRFAMVLVCSLYLLKYNLFKNNNANYIIPFTIVAFCITILFSPVGISAVLRSLGFWLVGLLIFKIVNLLFMKNSKRTSELLAFTVIIYLAINIILMFLPSELTYLLGRFRGLAGNPNGLALILIFSYALLSLLEKRKETTFKKGFFLTFKVAIFFVIFYTGSRTSLLSLIAFEFLLWYRKYSVLTFVMISVLFFFFTFFIDTDFLNNSQNISFLRYDSLINASGRTEVWPVAWEEVKNAPFFGNGFLYDKYFIKDYVSTNIGENAPRHWAGVWNSYLSLLLNVGFIGLIAYAYFFIQFFRKSHYKNLAIAFVTLCLLSAVTESWMAASMNPFTPIMFLFWAIQSQPATKIKSRL